jgi:hypothetical protein
MAVIDKLPACPQSGAGVHAWLFAAACYCARAGMNQGEAERLLASKMTRNPSPRTEVADAVNAAFREAGQSNRPWAGVHDNRPAPPPAWPQPNQEQREAASARHGSLQDLWELSPVRFNDDANHAEEVADILFPGNPLLCCGKGINVFDTLPRDEWRGRLASLQFIVPSPMLTRYGRRKRDGELSAHTINNTGKRRFLIVEQDSGSMDLQAGVLMHLSESAPLAMAVLSGGKSVHGWFFCEGRNEDSLRLWFRKAAVLGADPKLWTRSQFARMPDGKRDNGKRQEIIYFNPQAIK